MQPQEDGLVLKTLLITDLVASTRLIETVGDQRAAKLIGRHDRLARDLVERHRGWEVDKTDGFLMLFERPVDAVRFAVGFHRGLSELSAEEGVKVRARAGIHLGEVVLHQNPPEDVARGAKPLEVEGLAKPMTARLMSLGGGGQTLMSRGVFDVARRGAVGVEGAETLQWLAHGRYKMKGVAEPIEVFEVGEEEIAPLAPPADSEKVRRMEGDEILGWRPAPGLEIPRRPQWFLESKIGEGGFGEVWLAENRKTSAQRVFKFCSDADRLLALKREITIFRLLKEELGERRDIARILDWNFEAVPYFIESEYSSGGSLLDWAAKQGGLGEVPLATRLELVAQIAEALAAAHSVGVLHKDVKPANVLVSQPVGGEPRAQLTDFGIGMATDDQRLKAAGITVLGLVEMPGGAMESMTTGTQMYMAPELIEGRASTVQADIYALGVLLYQMVAGDFSRALAPGWERDVEDELLREDIAWAVDRSASRRLGNVQRIAERLRALESRRQERAREERARREAEQNREALARTRKRRKLVAAVMATLAVFAVFTALQARRIAREADRADREAVRATGEAVRANREAATARQVSEYLVEIFQLAQAEQSQGTEVTAREILDRGATRLERELAGQPAKQARLMNTLGRVYQGMGLYSAATPLLEEALEIRREIHGAEHLEVAESEESLAELASYKGDYDSAESFARQALETRRKLLGDEHPVVAAGLNVLASVLDYKGDSAAAEPLYRQSLAMRRKLLGDEHLDVASSLNNLGGLLMFQGEYAAAEPLLRESLAIRRKLLGDEHEVVADGLNDLAVVLEFKGDLVAAEPLYRQSLAMRRKLLGDEHPQVTESMSNLALLLMGRGDHSPAEQLLREALAIDRKLLGDEHESVALYQNNLARVLVASGDPAAAEPLIREALATFRNALPAGHFRIGNAESVLGSCLAGLGRYAEAERLLLASYPIIARETGERSQYTREALERTVALYQAWGKPEKAAQTRAVLATAGEPAP